MNISIEWLIEHLALSKEQEQILSCVQCLTILLELYPKEGPYKTSTLLIVCEEATEKEFGLTENGTFTHMTLRIVYAQLQKLMHSVRLVITIFFRFSETFDSISI